MAFENYDDIKVGDVIECFDVEEVQRDAVRAARATRSGAMVNCGAVECPRLAGNRSMSRNRSSDKENRSPGQRQLRVGEEIRHLLADLLERGNMRDPDLRDATITVTSVDVSPDLRNATAFVMPLGGQDRTGFRGVRRAAPWFRGRVSEKAGLRSAPEIRFELDRTFDEADRSARCCAAPDVARDIEDE